MLGFNNMASVFPETEKKCNCAFCSIPILWCIVLASQSPRMPLATETGERCFTSPIDQLGLTGYFTFTFYFNAFRNYNFIFLLLGTMLCNKLLLCSISKLNL